MKRDNASIAVQATPKPPIECLADRCLFAHDQADCAEIRHAAAFGEAQAEILGAGCFCRQFEQAT